MTSNETIPSARPAVPPATVERLRRVCLRLPEAREEAAWVGTRWTVRKKNFAHVLRIEAGWPPAYARAAGPLGEAGPLDVLTFRAPAAEFNVFSFAAPPFFRPGWWPDIVGMVLNGAAGPTDWDEVAVLVVGSYRALAPRALAARLDGDAQRC